MTSSWTANGAGVLTAFLPGIMGDEVDGLAVVGEQQAPVRLAGCARNRFSVQAPFIDNAAATEHTAAGLRCGGEGCHLDRKARHTDRVLGDGDVGTSRILDPDRPEIVFRDRAQAVWGAAAATTSMSAFKLADDPTPPDSLSTIPKDYLRSIWVQDPAGADITITQNPVGVSGFENEMATFTAAAQSSGSVFCGGSVVYEWRLNGEPIPGATGQTYSRRLLLSDNGKTIDFVAVSRARKPLARLPRWRSRRRHPADNRLCVERRWRLRRHLVQ